MKGCMQNFTKLMGLATVVTLGLSGTPAGATPINMLVNGSFETPSIAATNTFLSFNLGSTGITGWTVVGNSNVAIIPHTYAGLKASDGLQWVDLTGSPGDNYNHGLQSGAVTTVVGQTYTLSFDVGNYLAVGYATLGMSINGGAEQLFTNTSLATTVYAPMNWMHFSVDWVADAASMQVSFYGRANGSLSNTIVIGLDNVFFTAGTALESVEEPQSLALMGAGLLGLAFTSRRRAAM